MKIKQPLRNRVRCADTWLFLAAAVLFLLFLVAEILHHTSETPNHLSAFWRVLASLPIVALLYWGASVHYRRTASVRALNGVTWIAFGLYLYLVVNFTLLDAALGRWSASVYARTGNRRSYYMNHFVNLRPLYSIWNVYIRGFINGYVHAYYVVLNLLGNLGVFMPLAVFLPFFFKAQRRWYVFAGTMLLSVVAVETLQLLLMVGSCDVDDLILNAGGAMIAYFVLRIPFLQRLTDRFYRAASR